MANTPNIDLVKPAGTDHALVSVLNSNSDKIDSFAGTTNQAIAKLQDCAEIPSNKNVKDYCDSLAVGFYRIALGSSSTALTQGGPVANATILLVSKFSNDHIQIIAYPFANTYNLYKLSKYGGAWGSSWKKLILQDDVNNMFPTRGTAINSLGLRGVYGFVTTGGKNAHIFIPLNFDNNATGVTITSLVGGLRLSTGGYLGGADNFNFTSYITSIEVRILQNILYVICEKSDGWGATNNTTFNGLATMTGTVTA